MMGVSYRKYQKTSFRQKRFEQLLLEIIAELFHKGRVKDPVLINCPITLTQVTCSCDMRYAKAFFSTMSLTQPTKTELQKIAKALKRAMPFIMSQVGKATSTYRVPEITFHFDTELHRSERVWGLIGKIEGEPIHEGV